MVGKDPFDVGPKPDGEQPIVSTALPSDDGAVVPYESQTPKFVVRDGSSSGEGPLLDENHIPPVVRDNSPSHLLPPVVDKISTAEFSIDDINQARSTLDQVVLDYDMHAELTMKKGMLFTKHVMSDYEIGVFDWYRTTVNPDHNRYQVILVEDSVFDKNFRHIVDKYNAAHESKQDEIKRLRAEGIILKDNSDKNKSSIMSSLSAPVFQIPKPSYAHLKRAAIGIGVAAALGLGYLGINSGLDYFSKNKSAVQSNHNSVTSTKVESTKKPIVEQKKQVEQKNIISKAVTPTTTSVDKKESTKTLDSVLQKRSVVPKIPIDSIRAKYNIQHPSNRGFAPNLLSPVEVRYDSNSDVVIIDQLAGRNIAKTQLRLYGISGDESPVIISGVSTPVGRSEVIRYSTNLTQSQRKLLIENIRAKKQEMSCIGYDSAGIVKGSFDNKTTTTSVILMELSLPKSESPIASSDNYKNPSIDANIYSEKISTQYSKNPVTPSVFDAVTKISSQPNTISTKKIPNSLENVLNTSAVNIKPTSSFTFYGSYRA